MTLLQPYTDRLIKLEVQKSLLNDELSKCFKIIEETEEEAFTKKYASELLQLCSVHLRTTMSKSVEETVTWAVRHILNGNWSFKMDFAQKRSQWECSFKLIDPEGNETDLKNGSGGGIIDIMSLSLFVMFAALFSGDSRIPVFMDEPLRNLSTEVPEIANRAVNFLRGITEKLNMQLIVLTHQEPLVKAADKAYRFELERGVCKATDITESKPVYSE